MSKNIRRDLTAIWLCVALCLSGPVSYCAEDLNETQAVTGISAITELGEEAVIAVKDYLEDLDEEDLAELKKNIEAIRAMLTSESFRSLISYTEVQDLIILALLKAEDLMVEDTQLTSKVLVTLGIEEKYADMILKIIQIAAYSREELEKSTGSDTKEAEADIIRLILSEPQILDGVIGILGSLTKN